METSISWTDFTFNIVWGCVEISEACDYCYAREWAAKMGWDIWGKDKARRTFDEHYWNNPIRWNRRALEKFRRPARVFCSSMADIFESHPTTQQELVKLPSLIARTPNLQWLLLTKHGWDKIHRYPALTALPNAFFGVTMELQSYGYRITDHVRWLSIEPMLGPIDLENVRVGGSRLRNVLNGRFDNGEPGAPIVDWVIVGGESEDDKNPKARGQARPMRLEWVLDLKKQCEKYNVAFHFKQTGHRLAEELDLKNKAGKDPEEWPDSLRVQDFPKWQSEQQPILL